MTTLRAEELSKERRELAGWAVGITTWRRESTWICHVDNVDPGAVIARAQAPSREAALEAALARAEPKLRATRRFPLREA